MEMEEEVADEADNSSNTVDEVDFPPNNYIYRWIDVFFVLGGIFTYFMDWVSFGSYPPLI